MPGRFVSIDDYISSFPASTAGRKVIHFAGWKRHVSVYPVPAGGEDYERRIAPYRSGKGTAKFPLDQPVPYDLVEQMAALLASG